MPGTDSEVARTQAVDTDSAVAGTEVSGIEVVGIGTAERGVGTCTAAADARCTFAVGLIR